MTFSGELLVFVLGVTGYKRNTSFSKLELDTVLLEHVNLSCKICMNLVLS